MFARFREQGFALVDKLISEKLVGRLSAELSGHSHQSLSGGYRYPEKSSTTVQTLINSQEIRECARTFLNTQACFVRAIFFSKSKTNNWHIRWHQDRTIAVSKRIDVEGWGPWSLKDGQHHVQVPVAVLESMIAIRIHLDETTAENGCLQVIPGSHQLGLLDSDKIPEYVKGKIPVNCEGKSGSALIMRPNLLHSSAKIKNSLPRRVLHLEFCSFQLPSGLSWA